MKINKTQAFIMSSLRQNGVLQCSEGKNYKAWIRFDDGSKKTVRRDQADKFCQENNVTYGVSKLGLYTEVTLKN